VKIRENINTFLNNYLEECIFPRNRTTDDGKEEK
jgi:hypothetical protein